MNWNGFPGMSITSELHTAHVAEAFDSVANSFEAALENDITRTIRRRIYTLIESLLSPESTILDINCGVGIDTVELAKRGYRVTGSDLSPEMVREARVRSAQHHTGIEFTRTSFEDLSPFSERTFDMVFSNFGGLNCVPTLETVAAQVSQVVKLGGYFVAVVMPPFSLWELLAGSIKVNFRFAFRRLRRRVPASGFGESVFSVSYYSPRTFARVFNNAFEVKLIRGMNIISPPPHATRFVGSFPRLVKWLDGLEQTLAALPVFRSLGDHYIIVLRRRNSTQETA